MNKVDTLLVGSVIVTMNESYDIIPNGAVAINDNLIVALGPQEDILATYEATNTLDVSGQIIMPGLVNAHTHLPMTLLRGLADDLRLDVWLMGYMMPVEREFVSPDFCYQGTLLACAEMIRGGTTSMADMYYFEDDIARAVADSGLRGVLGESIIKFPTPDAQSYEESLEYTRNFIKKWQGHPLITPAIAPHAPYTNTTEILKASTELALEFDVPLLTHIAETRLEVEESRRDHDMPVVPYVRGTGLLDAKVVAAHCVHVDEGEMRTLAKMKTSVAHNPSSNLKLASGIAPIHAMLERGITVGIGTDGTASNNDLDMFDEMRLATFIAKGSTYDPTAVPARQVLNMATRMGAESIFLGDITGSLEVGKRADIITLDPRTLHNSPRFNRDPNAVYSQIVYAAKSTDVTNVMVDGKLLMRDRELLTIDETAVLKAADEYARKIDAFLSHREGNVLSKLVAIGGLEREESFEIQVKARVENRDIVDQLLAQKNIQLIRHTHYRQYDTYFLFQNSNQGLVRYREDDALGANRELTGVRTRLTYTEPTNAEDFGTSILLSRSRFIAPADRPLRFYQEYFQSDDEYNIEKDRLRWHILYKGILFYVNLDQLNQPHYDGYFLEIKSRTWSSHDAQYKAELTGELLEMLGITSEDTVRGQYLDWTRLTPRADEAS